MASLNGPPRRSRQLRLALGEPLGFGRGDFIVSDCNREAATLIDNWPDWPNRRLALVGPPGSGKSHLAGAWAARSGATAFGRGGANSSVVLVENADAGFDEEQLFHLFNRGGETTSLLFTARTAPAAWPAALPDLVSRLASLTTVSLTAPDDRVLEGVLRRLFRARRIRPAEDVYAYILRRIERSVEAAEDVVSRLDDMADAQGREVNRALVRQALEQEESGDLFN